MKKILLVALVAIMTVSASAQIVSVSNKEIKTKTPSQKIHYVQGAIGFLSQSSNYQGIESAIGFDFLWGYEKPLGYGIWWGQEVGLGTSRGYSTSHDTWEETFRTYSVRYTPANFGYRYRINSNWAVEGHLGIGVSFDFAGGEHFKDTSKKTGKVTEESDRSIWDMNDYVPLDVMLKLGAGFTYKCFGFDISWQKGFVKPAKNDDITASNVFLGVRYVY
ncbi:MAG: hypothetical protein HUK00_06465 [Bacteroidaceae bacterium]|mgnify:CR=1 FL=1|nr:hypothetical protein [Bacteroidaceae bacterium]